MSSAPTAYLTPEEYLEQERKAERKSEYFRGEVFAMAGASPEHILIVGNIFAGLHQQLRKSRCNVYSNDLRVAVTPTGLYTYPDVVVVCEPLTFADQHRDTVTNPVIIIEVLSDSTKDYDRGRKLESYRRLPSLMGYLTVAQDKIHIEHWIRQPDQHWLLRESNDPGARLKLEPIDVELLLADIYEKVELPGL